MPPITLEVIQSKQSELDTLIQQFKEQSSVRRIEIDGRTIELQPGERYAGAKLDDQGNHLHDVIVLSARSDDNHNFDGALRSFLYTKSEASSDGDQSRMDVEVEDLPNLTAACMSEWPSLSRCWRRSSRSRRTP